MKKIIALAVTASALLAGPDVGALIDYEAQDTYNAKVQEVEQYDSPEPRFTPESTFVPARITPKTPIETSGCLNSADIIGGQNFTQSDGALDDSPLAGVRFNKCITKNSFVQLGYEYVFTADYNIDRNDGYAINKDARYEKKTVVASSKSSSNLKDTPANRVYINGLYEIANENTLFPFVYAGLGYEMISDEAYAAESGGFANVGGGLKYKISDTLNLIAETKALQKFANSDLDIMAGLGLGLVFGENREVDEFEAQYDDDLVDSISYQDNSYNEQYTQSAPSIVQTNYNQTPQADNGTYYIQIATLYENNLGAKSSSYIQSLEESGLNYETKQTTIRGRSVELLLVGPYFSDAGARADLPKAKRVEKGAFIKKIRG
jgi:hypothetical protein